MAKLRVNMRIREELWARVKQVALERGMDRTAVVEEALERVLAPPPEQSYNGGAGEGDTSY